jgi:H+/gluconate symporter-like permease
VVLPAAAFNTVTMFVLYPIASSIVKRTRTTVSKHSFN